MYHAFLGASDEMPFRASILSAANRWNMAPWELTGRDNLAERLRWMKWQSAYDAEYARAQKHKNR
jgi:hypothetical protein